jgi:chromosome segregation ATPase
MGDETQQLIIRFFSVLKEDIRAVAIGQDDLKEELKDDISAVKDDISTLETNVKGDISALETNVDDISALETKINAGQEELRHEISVFQERIKDIEAGQAEFEERVTRNLREDFSRNIEATRQDIEATRPLLFLSVTIKETCCTFKPYNG